MATNRTCKVCGKRYYFCPNCDWSERKDKPMWMIMFDCENCQKIYTVISDRFWKKISDEEAVARLLELDLSEMDKLATFNSSIKKEIEELLSSAEKHDDAVAATTEPEVENIVPAVDEYKPHRHNKKKD